MAGSFGYEKEHFDISLAIGETKLFPALRELVMKMRRSSPTASPAGSKSQPASARRRVHIAEALADALG